MKHAEWRWALGFASLCSWVRQSAARGRTRSERGRPSCTAARGAVARVERGERGRRSDRRPSGATLRGESRGGPSVCSAGSSPTCPRGLPTTSCELPNTLLLMPMMCTASNHRPRFLNSFLLHILPLYFDGGRSATQICNLAFEQSATCIG